MLKILKFLNLLDNENSLSLTNLSLYIVLFKIPFSHSFADIAIILPAIALYAHKKVLVTKSKQKSSIVEDFEKLTAQVESLSKRTESNQILFSTVEAQSNEAKRILAGAQNNNLFIPRKDR